MRANKKTRRLSFRITWENKKLLERVAARHGMSVSDYFVNLANDFAGHELTER